MSALTESAAWRALETHAQTLTPNVPSLFSAQPDRVQKFSATGAGLYLDYSKQRANGTTLTLLRRLAASRDLAGWIERLFAGDAVNSTENRAAFHMALRAPRRKVMKVGGRNVAPQVHKVLDQACRFAEQVRKGLWKGCGGDPITDVVNIGIGGSDLGPRFVCEALGHLPSAQHGPRVHFVSNVDGADLDGVLKKLDPKRTLWIITSKTFTTQETMANAHAARLWFRKSCRAKDVARHFVAVSTNRADVIKFGIDASNMFEFWEWVGGRYSLWSAVGLSIALRIGATDFRAMLSGAHAMDEHFRKTPPTRNLPVIMGLLGVWNTNFLGSNSHVLAPYDQRLQKFPAWLQQLEMESNGKSVDRDGLAVDYATTPVLWGDVGTNAQHAYFQMLHQAPQRHPIDFILAIKPDHGMKELHTLLVANALAQGAAFMSGKDAETVRAELVDKGFKGKKLKAAVPHRVFSGNRPSNTLLLPQLDARNLGALLALYEHRAFVQSVIWNINPFDQWGVELGKQLAGRVLKSMAGPKATDLDPSTESLIRRIQRG